jgi:hypothetical protein
MTKDFRAVQMTIFFSSVTTSSQRSSASIATSKHASASAASMTRLELRRLPLKVCASSVLHVPIPRKTCLKDGKKTHLRTYIFVIFLRAWQICLADDCSRWKYEYMTSMDGNFSLGLKDGKTKRSDDDPEMLSGSAFMVDEKEYQEFITANEKAHPSTADVSECTEWVHLAAHQRTGDGTHLR